MGLLENTDPKVRFSLSETHRVPKTLKIPYTPRQNGTTYTVHDEVHRKEKIDFSEPNVLPPSRGCQEFPRITNRGYSRRGLLIPSGPKVALVLK